MDLDVEAVGPESRLADLGMDSLDRVEYTMAAEEALGMELPDDIAESVHTVGDAARAAFTALSAGGTRGAESRA
jgi:acyl carrier protein